MKPEVLKQPDTWHVSSEVLKMSVNTGDQHRSSGWMERQNQGSVSVSRMETVVPVVGEEGASEVGSCGKDQAPAVVGELELV